MSAIQQMLAGFGGGGWKFSGPSLVWTDLASSADGSRVVAVAAPGNIWVSSDAGVTWTARSYSRDYLGVVCSDDGLTILASFYTGSAQVVSLTKSTDYGVNWNNVGTQGNHRRIAWARDTNTLFILNRSSSSSTSVFKSTDLGLNLSVAPIDTNQPYQGIAVSRSGAVVLLSKFNSSNSALYVSPDGGATWAIREAGKTWYDVACSATGAKMVASVYNGIDAGVYISNDMGASWVRTTGYLRDVISVGMSDDGTVVAFTVYGGDLFVSTDGGQTWEGQGTVGGWSSITVSGDGQKVYAAQKNGAIYRSS